MSSDYLVQWVFNIICECAILILSLYLVYQHATINNLIFSVIASVWVVIIANLTIKTAIECNEELKDEIRRLYERK